MYIIAHPKSRGRNISKLGVFFVVDGAHPFVKCNLSFTRDIMICNTIMTEDAMVKQLKGIVKNLMAPDVPTKACQ